MPYSETQLASARFDQPEHDGPVRKIFICSTPRSGSNTLCRMMVSAGLGLPLEYYNPVLIPPIAERFGFDAARTHAILNWRGRKSRIWRLLTRNPVADFVAAYSAALQRRRTVDGIFAAKMHFWQYQRVLDHPIGRDILRGGTFVYVYREDLLSQAVSTHVSHLTGVWDFDGVATTAQHAEPDFLNPSRIRHEAQDIADQDRDWRMFFIDNGIRPITASFETFIGSPDRFVGRIAAAVGHRLDPASLAEAGGERYPEQQKPSKAEIIAHFLAATSRLDQQPNRGASATGRPVAADVADNGRTTR